MVPPGRSTLRLRVLALVPLAACGGTVPLGYECPALALHCEPGGGDGHDDGPPSDAGRPDAGVPVGGPDAAVDAGPTPPVDAGVDASLPEDAGAPIFPAIENGTFRITSEPPTPGDVNLLSDTRIAPWLWCAGSVEVGPDLGGHTPTDGDSLLAMAFGAGPALLGQPLAEPLQAGQPYAIAIDLARGATGSDELRLEVLGTELTCASPEKLAETGPLEATEDLRTYCLRFTPSERHSYLTLRISPLTALGTVYLDNLRPAVDCP